MSVAALLPQRGGLGGAGARRLVRLVYHVILVRFLFHLFGFWGGIGVLVAVALAIYLYGRYRNRHG